MLDKSGIHQGVAWSVVYKGARLVELTVGEKVESYTCMYEPTFGLDVADQNEINLRLDAMQGLS